MKPRHAILTLLLTLMEVGAWAGDAKIVVWQKDGAKTEILFNRKPEFLYQDGNVSLQNGGTTLSWRLADLRKLTFEDIEAPNGIDEIKTDAKLDIVRGCAVYDLSGRLVKRQIRSLSELPKGTYILKDGSVTTKVVRR